MPPTTTMRPPSLPLLRAFLKPQMRCSTQTRSSTNWMPREKYAQINRLDKLHRKQKIAEKQERINSQLRAQQMQPPSLFDSSQSPSRAPPQTLSETDTVAATPSHPSSSTPPTTKPTLPYSITRTTSPSRNLPIYESTKSGGSMHITTIRRCSGDLHTLQQHLLTALGLEPGFIEKRDGKKRLNVKVNSLTKHVVVRGWRKAEVEKFCAMAGF